MIRPPGFRGAAFGTAAEGDGRSDAAARGAISGHLGISPDWAYLSQVHGRSVITATAPGSQGEGDALITTKTGLPIAVATADCIPVVIEADDAVAVVHAGWRGSAAGVVAAAREALAAGGHRQVRAAIGPGIGPCCYEVGPDVTERFPGFVSETRWGTPSIDLPGFVAEALGDLEVWSSGICTFDDDAMHSYRQNRTRSRQVAIGWLPA